MSEKVVIPGIVSFHPAPVSRLLNSIRSWFGDRRVRELLLWCLPALLAGLVLRVVLTVHLPYAYFHNDGPDFFTTVDKLFHEHEFALHSKKTFLVPVLFTIPFFLGLPVLIILPIFQHLLGLALVVLVGVLCRLWFTHWKVFIVPLTVITAINPAMIFYEHTTMAETIFVFCTALLALAGTLYAMEQTRGHFIFLCVALVLEAGARPEGKLLFGFGLFLLFLIHFRELRKWWPRIAIMAVLAFLTHLGTKTAQGGLLLYTSVVRFTPKDLKIAPGFEPYVAPLREDLQKRWDEYPQFPGVPDRKALAAAVKEYMLANGMKAGTHSKVNEYCSKLAAETCLRNLPELPILVYHKFRYTATQPSGSFFDESELFKRQRAAFTESDGLGARLSRGLTGKRMETEAELNAFIDQNYGNVSWFNDWTTKWSDAVNHFRLKDRIYKYWIRYPGIPYYFLLATLGLIAITLRPGRQQPFHIAWSLALLGFFFVIMLAANVRPRFRFVFEPFWFIYALLLLDLVWSGIASLFSRKAS